MSLATRVMQSVGCLFVVVAVVLMPSVTDAQIAEDLQSHILFDIRLDKLREYTDAQGIDLNQLVSMMTDGELDPEVTATISRIYGSFQLPKDMATIEPLIGQMFRPIELGDEFDSEKMPDFGDDKKMDSIDRDDDGAFDDNYENVSIRREIRQQDFELPINFFVRMDFKDAASAASFAESNMWPNPEPREIDGNTYYPLPDEADGPSNLVWWKPKDNTIEIGTMDYVTHSSRRLFTPRLTSTWGAMPDEAVRLAVDLESVSGFMDEVANLASENAPPGMEEQAALLKSISTVSLSLDLQADNLVSLSIEGKDAAGADALEGTLDQQLNMAKMLGGMATGEISRTSPKAGEVANEVIQSLKVTRTDNKVGVFIARPADMDAAVAEGLVAMQARAKQVARMNNIRQVCLSVHNYHDAYGGFPFHPKGTVSPDLSWRARVSMFMEGPQTDAQKAHDDPANAPFLDQMPAELGSDGKNTNVFWIDNGDGGPNDFADIMDGSSNTIMLLESPDKSPWMKPHDLTVDEAAMLISALQPGESLIAAMYDGSTREIQAGLDEETIRKLLTYKGGEVIEFDELDRN